MLYHLSQLLSAAVRLSICHQGFELSCRGWSGVRILNNQMPSGSRSFIRDHGLHRKNMMLHLRLTHTESGRSSMSQILIKKVRSPMSAFGTKETWATEGYRRVAAPQAGHDFDSMSFPDQHTVATQSSALCMSPQMLDAILRSSDAAAFSTEDLTRLQDGISQQLSDRARHASQPAHASRGVAPPELIGVSDPYRPTTPPCSSTAKVKPIFELNDD